MAEDSRTTPAARPLLRILGIFSGLAIAVGGTIASGIFRTPGVVARELGDVALILGLWAFGGAVFLCGALTYGELGSRYPRSGGLFTFIHQAYGRATGFAYGLLFALIIGPGAVGTLAVVFGEYALRLTGGPPERLPLLALGAILVFGITNYVGLRWGARTLNVLTTLKVVGLGGLVVVAFLHPPAPGAGAPLPDAHRESVGLLVALALAFQSVIWSFDGFSDPVKVGEEIENPDRNIPRALVGGVLVISLVYLLVNAAFLRALPLEEMVRSNLPASDAAVRLFGPPGGAFIVVLAIVSVLGTLNESILVNPRIAYAMGREGLLLPAFTRVNEGGTPTVALVWNAVVGAVLALTGTFETLLAIIAFALAVGEVAATGSLFVFRWREPDTVPGFRVPGYPVVPAVFLLVNLGVAVSLVLLRTSEALLGVGVILLALVIYAVWRPALRTSSSG